MPGRPRTPTNILKMRGAGRKHPERMRERANEPIITEAIGRPPKCFTLEERQAWKQIVTQCAKGVLTRADTIAVSIAARLLAKEFLGKNSDSAGRRLDSLLGKFGMTPSERSKVSAAPKNPERDKPANRFAGRHA